MPATMAPSAAAKLPMDSVNSNRLTCSRYGISQSQAPLLSVTKVLALDSKSDMIKHCLHYHAHG